MVVPVLLRHQGGDAETQHGRAHGDGLGGLALRRVVQPLVKGGHAEADPDGEHIERSRIGIVPFAHLVRRLVEVQDDGDARHEEHQEHDPGTALVPVELEHQAQQAQEQRQEEIVVLALVVGEDGGSVPLVAEADPVDETDAAFPVPVEQFTRGRAVDIVLAADEIPHEVPPVHPVELVIEEEAQVGAEGGLLVGRPLHADALSVHVGLVEIHMGGAGVGPHPREQHLAFGEVVRIGRSVHMGVLPVQRSPVLAGLQVIGRIEILAVQERRGAVLLAGEIAHQRIGVVRLVFVRRRLDGGTDDDDGEQGETDHERRHAEHHRVPEHLVLLERMEQRPETEGQERHHEEQRSAVVREPEAVHEDAVEEGRQLGQIRDEQEHEQELDDHADHENAQQALERQLLVLVLPVIVHEHESRDGEEVQEVDADGKAHQEGDQDDPAVRMGLVGLFVPLAHGPEDQGRHERRHRIDLALHGGEPKRVGEGIGQGAHGAGTEDRDRLRQGIAFLPGLDQPLGEEDRRQIQEEDGEGRQDAVHRIHRHSRLLRRNGDGEDAGEQLENRVSRGVSHLQLVGGGNEFSAVPEGGGGLYGGEIRHGRNHEDGGGDDPVPQVESLLVHVLLFAIFCKDTNISRYLCSPKP